MEPGKPSDRLDRQHAAEAVGISLAAWDKQRGRGTLPEPDGKVGNSNWWYRRTLTRWDRQRRRRPSFQLKVRENA